MNDQLLNIDIINKLHVCNTFVNIALFCNKLNKQFKTKDDFESVISELVRIHGINRSKAIELYNEGIRSIKDVIDSDIVTERIKICAKYVDELEKRVPREHITEIIEIMKKECKDVVSVTGVGSYRRLKKTSGDIDVLICVSNITDSKEINKKIKTLPFYIYTTDEGEQSMRIIVKWNKGVYFMDVVYTTPIEFGAALMHTTGSMKFNIVMSVKAIKRGYKLSIHGLFYRETDERVNGTDTEEGIFEKLSVKFIPPELRENKADYKKYFIK